MPPVKTSASRRPSGTTSPAIALASDVAEEVEGELRPLVPSGRRLFDRPHVVRKARDAEEARLLVQDVEDLLRVLAHRIGHMADDRRVDRPAAGPHHQPLERGQPHRRVDALPVLHGRAGAAVAEVSRHDPVVVRGEAREGVRPRGPRSGGSSRGSRSGGRRTSRATRAAPGRCRRPAASSGGRRCRRRRPAGAPGRGSARSGCRRGSAGCGAARGGCTPRPSR